MGSNPIRSIRSVGVAGACLFNKEKIAGSIPARIILSEVINI